MDFFFNPTPKQTAMSFVFALVMFGAAIALVRFVNPAHAATPNVFKWEGSPPNTKVALIADLGACQVFRIRVFTTGQQSYKEVFVTQRANGSTTPSCGIAS